MYIDVDKLISSYRLRSNGNIRKYRIYQTTR